MVCMIWNQVRDEYRNITVCSGMGTRWSQLSDRSPGLLLNPCVWQCEASCSMTCAASQFTWWSWSCTWTAMSFFLSPLLTAALCSTNLFCRFLPVSSMYFLSQSMQGTSYTTPFFFNAGLAVFTCVRVWRRVPLDLKTALTPSLLQIRSVFGGVSLGFSSSSSSAWSVSSEVEVVPIWMGIRLSRTFSVGAGVQASVNVRHRSSQLVVLGNGPHQS